MPRYLESEPGVIDKKIGQLVKVLVHCWKNVCFNRIELERLEGDLAFDRFGFPVDLGISIHEENFFDPEEVLTLDDQEIISFVDKLKIERSIRAQIFWGNFHTVIEVDDRN